MSTTQEVAPLRVNGVITSQEEIRRHAEVLAVLGITTVEQAMAGTILALLDLLESYEDLTDHLTGADRDE